MKRLSVAVIICLCFVSLLSAQTTIDKPAATIKLTKQEIISVRQLKADVDKLEKATNQKLKQEQVLQVLEARINSMLFVQYCDREKITIQETAVTQRISQMKTELGGANVSDAALEKAMQAEGIFVDPKTYARQRLLFSAYVQAKKAAELKAAQAAPSVEQIRKAYDTAKSTLIRPDTVRLSVLFVDFRGKSEDEKKAARETMRGLGSTLKLNPSKFDDYLLDGLGGNEDFRALSSIFVEKTQQSQTVYGKDMFDFVFAKKIGDISPILESQAGVQIVRINEFLPQKQLALTDTIPGDQNTTVLEYLSYELSMQKQADFMDKIEADLIALIKKEAAIKIFDENIKF